MRFLILMSALAFSTLNASELPGWPESISEIRIRSTKDGTEQPALVWSPPERSEKRPLLVGLHTWSFDYKQAQNGTTYLKWAMKHGWHYLQPNFRGVNNTPEALASDLAVQDVVDAVNHLKASGTVDETRVYLIGASGGGHMGLMLAGRHPEIWAGVSAWVPIADVAIWHSEHVVNGEPDRYAKDIESALGGPPDLADRVKDAFHRSPVRWLDRAREVPLDIHHGVHDGRKGSVPFRHSLNAFNQVAKAEDRLSEAEISEYYETQMRPAGWAAPDADPLYGENRVLFRRVSGNARVTIFDGGHDILYTPALNWLAQQQKGQPSKWEIQNPISAESDSEASGK